MSSHVIATAVEATPQGSVGTEVEANACGTSVTRRTTVEDSTHGATWIRYNIMYIHVRNYVSVKEVEHKKTLKAFYKACRPMSIE